MMKKVVLLLSLLILLGAAVAWSSDTEYRVGEGDVLKVTVYDHPDLSTTVRVGSDGAVLFPLIGQVNIGGKTTSSVAQTLGKALSEGYIVNPQVSVFVEEFRSKRVVINGYVKKPGMFELSGPTSLLELLSKAEGLTKEAGYTAIIRRKSLDGGPEKVITVDLKPLLEGGGEVINEALMDGDNVFIDKAGLVYVTGEVKKPDAYKYEDNTTVIKAITMAGGFTNIAGKSRVRIVRKVEGTEQVFKGVDMHEPVQPGDIIVVPESFF